MWRSNFSTQFAAGEQAQGRHQRAPRLGAGRLLRRGHRGLRGVQPAGLPRGHVRRPVRRPHRPGRPGGPEAPGGAGEVRRRRASNVREAEDRRRVLCTCGKFVVAVVVVVDVVVAAVAVDFVFLRQSLSLWGTRLTVQLSCSP